MARSSLGKRMLFSAAAVSLVSLGRMSVDTEEGKAGTTATASMADTAPEDSGKSWLRRAIDSKNAFMAEYVQIDPPGYKPPKKAAPASPEPAKPSPSKPDPATPSPAVPADTTRPIVGPAYLATAKTVPAGFTLVEVPLTGTPSVEDICKAAEANAADTPLGKTCEYIPGASCAANATGQDVTALIAISLENKGLLETAEAEVERFYGKWKKQAKKSKIAREQKEIADKLGIANGKKFTYDRENAIHRAGVMALYTNWLGRRLKATGMHTEAYQDATFQAGLKGLKAYQDGDRNPGSAQAFAYTRDALRSQLELLRSGNGQRLATCYDLDDGLPDAATPSPTRTATPSGPRTAKAKKKAAKKARTKAKVRAAAEAKKKKDDAAEKRRAAIEADRKRAAEEAKAKAAEKEAAKRAAAAKKKKAGLPETVQQGWLTEKTTKSVNDICDLISENDKRQSPILSKACWYMPAFIKAANVTGQDQTFLIGVAVYGSKLNQHATGKGFTAGRSGVMMIPSDLSRILQQDYDTCREGGSEKVGNLTCDKYMSMVQKLGLVDGDNVEDLTQDYKGVANNVAYAALYMSRMVGAPGKASDAHNERAAKRYFPRNMNAPIHTKRATQKVRNELGKYPKAVRKKLAPRHR